MRRHSPVPAYVVDNIFRRNDANTSELFIVFQLKKHMASERVGDGGNGRVHKEIENVEFACIMSVNLGRDTCNTTGQGGAGASRYGTPPLVCDCAGGENDREAPCHVLRNLIRELDGRHMAGGGGLERTSVMYA